MVDQKESFTCFCNARLVPDDEEELKRHIKNCETYHSSSPIYKLMASLPLKNLSKAKIIALKLEFQLYINKINQEMAKRNPGKNITEKKNPPEEKKIQIIEKIGQKIDNDEEKIVQKNPIPNNDFQFTDDQMACSNPFCKKQDQFFCCPERCVHMICLECLKKILKENFIKTNGSVKCLDKSCKEIYTNNFIKEYIGNEEFKKLQEAVDNIDDNMLVENIVSCCKCQEKIMFEEGKVYNMKDATGKPVSLESATHYAKNR